MISISSVNGQKGQFGQTNYAAAKAAAIGFTKALAQEGAALGITVNCVCPGYIGTEMVKAVPEEVLKAKILPQIPVGRLGEPEEIARCVVFLASDEAGFITGSTLSRQWRPVHGLTVGEGPPPVGPRRRAAEAWPRKGLPPMTDASKPAATAPDATERMAAMGRIAEKSRRVAELWLSEGGGQGRRRCRWGRASPTTSWRCRSSCSPTRWRWSRPRPSSGRTI